MKVAILHEMLIKLGGAEKVVENFQMRRFLHLFMMKKSAEKYFQEKKFLLKFGNQKLKKDIIFSKNKDFA